MTKDDKNTAIWTLAITAGLVAVIVVLWLTGVFDASTA